MGKLVRGVGIYQKGKYVAKIDRTPTKEYKLWESMLDRCYSSNVHSRQPHYAGCSVHPDFIKFQDFAEWCSNQIGFGEAEYALDKDILIPGNKEYGPDTCVFVPRCINQLLTHNQSDNSGYPVGVHYHKNTGNYCATIRIDGKKKHIGSYTTISDASTAYATQKEIYIKEKAEQFKDRIDPRVYSALMNYKLAQN